MNGVGDRQVEERFSLLEYYNYRARCLTSNWNNGDGDKSDRIRRNALDGGLNIMVKVSLEDTLDIIKCFLLIEKYKYQQYHGLSSSSPHLYCSFHQMFIYLFYV
jgi:hypothetical protein